MSSHGALAVDKLFGPDTKVDIVSSSSHEDSEFAFETRTHLWWKIEYLVKSTILKDSTLDGAAKDRILDEVVFSYLARLNSRISVKGTEFASDRSLRQDLDGFFKTVESGYMHELAKMEKLEKKKEDEEKRNRCFGLKIFTFCFNE